MFAGCHDCVLVVVLVLCFLHMYEKVNGQLSDDTEQTELDCEQRLMEEVYTCVSSRDIDFNVFLVIVSSDTPNTETSENSTQPPYMEKANTTASEFRDRLCGARDTVMKCILDTAKDLMALPACARPPPGTNGNAFNQDLLINDQRYLLKEQIEAIVGQYDVFCAHPCRISLLDDMRACYSKHDLDPKLFIATDSSGPVIGADAYDVNIFCKERGSIVSCLKQTRDDCEESHLVLGSIGLDLNFMGRGFKVLCDNNETYLESLDCFDSHTHEVGFCHSIKHRGVISVARRAQEHKWSEEKYFEEICRVILRHIQCDLDAWSQKHDKDCNEDTLGLKRKLHCSLIPEQCERAASNTVKDICNPDIQFNAAPSKPIWDFPLVILAFFLFMAVHE